MTGPGTDARFEQGLACHNQGRLDDAIAHYQSVIEADPYHAGAVHLLGVALSQKGQFDLAAQFIQSAIILNAGVPEFHINLGNALAGAGRYEEAGQAYAGALALNKALPEAWFGMGNVRMALGRAQESVDAYEQALLLRPDFIQALVNMAKPLMALVRYDDALIAVKRAIGLRPSDSLPRFVLAQVLDASGHPAEAAALYAHLAEDGGAPVGVLFEAANRLAELGAHDQAVALYRAALDKAPREAVLWNNMANSLRRLDRLADAKAAYENAWCMAPDDAEILSNLGAVVKDMGDLPVAVDLLRRSIAMGGGVMARSNLGHALYLQGDIDGAGRCFRDALGMAPGDPDATFHLGIVDLLTGNWADGWREYEARWSCRDPQESRRHPGHPRWDGGDVSSKTILLWSEQGLGDTLQFVRFADALAERGAAVVVECQAGLVPLVAAMPSVSKAVAVGADPGPFDCHAPLLSLPYLLGITLENYAWGGPYLAAPRSREAALPSRPCIGLVWAGEARRQSVECLLIDRRRSMSLDTLAPVLDLPGLHFVSLQLGPSREQLRGRPLIGDPMDGVRDFADTAAIIDRLDAVVGVDTSVIHLAGAMGKPVYMLSRFDGCWRWLRDRMDSPWYPSLQIYAQERPGDWSGPVARLAADLAGRFRMDPQG